MVSLIRYTRQNETPQPLPNETFQRDNNYHTFRIVAIQNPSAYAYTNEVSNIPDYPNPFTTVEYQVVDDFTPRGIAFSDIYTSENEQSINTAHSSKVVPLSPQDLYKIIRAVTLEYDKAALAGRFPTQTKGRG